MRGVGPQSIGWNDRSREICSYVSNIDNLKGWVDVLVLAHFHDSVAVGWRKTFNLGGMEACAWGIMAVTHEVDMFAAVLWSVGDRRVTKGREVHLLFLSLLSLVNGRRFGRRRHDGGVYRELTSRVLFRR